jgi:Ca-activated chloride channel homolog
MATNTKKAFKCLMITASLILPLVLSSPAGTQSLVDPSRISLLPSKQSQSGSSPTTWQDKQDDVIRVDTNLITIPSSVMDRDGRYVTNLKKEDFQIFEDGVEQEVSFFEPVEKPFTALLLIDNSGSMRNYVSDLTRAANAFVDQLRPEDRLAVATFSDRGRIQLLLEATKIIDLHKKITLSARMGDDFTTTFNAVKLGIRYMKNLQGRRAMILFSDGEQYGNGTSAKSNFRDAEEQEVLIYTIRFGAFPTHQPGYMPYVSRKDDLRLIERVNAYMQGLAQKTGGRSYQVGNISSLEETFRMVANELGRQYSLGYYPTKPLQPGQRRQIKVKVDVPDLVVRARDSYIVDKKFGQAK